MAYFRLTWRDGAIKTVEASGATEALTICGKGMAETIHLLNKTETIELLQGKMDYHEMQLSRLRKKLLSIEKEEPEGGQSPGSAASGS